MYIIAPIPKLLWPLYAIQTDGLVGLIRPNRVLLALAFRLKSFGNRVIHHYQPYMLP